MTPAGRGSRKGLLRRLISAPYRRLLDFEERHPLTRLFTDRLRDVVLIVDTALAALIVLGWVLTRGLFAKLTLGRSKPASGTVCFLSQEGFTVAPARVRTYYFAARVARLGIPTKTLAFWDDIYGFPHLPDRILFSCERVVAALKAANRLLADPPAAIVEQRPNYELVTTWAVHWVFGTPIVFDIDDWIGDYIWFHPVRVRTVLRWCSSLSPVCIVSSARLQEEMSPIFPSVVRIPTYVDTETFEPRRAPRPSTEVVFGWNGTLFQDFMYEALLVLLRAFCRACDRLGEGASVAFEIAGTGHFLAAVEKALTTEFSGYPIRIKGWIDPATMAQYLDGIDVGLYSLTMPRKGPNSQDAKFIVSKSPTKVFEYMAKGLPTISTRFGEVASFIQNGVTGYCSDDPEVLTEAFVGLATNAELRAGMGAAARRLCVEQYSMSSAAAMLAGVLKDVTGAELRSAARPSRVAT